MVDLQIYFSKTLHTDAYVVPVVLEVGQNPKKKGEDFIIGRERVKETNVFTRTFEKGGVVKKKTNSAFV